MAKELHCLGYHLAKPLDTLPHEASPEGVWESSEIRKINSNLFRMYNFTSPQNAPLFPFLLSPRITKWAKAQEERQVIIKEPMLASTWPVWVRSLEMISEVRVVNCTRDREETLRSCLRVFGPSTPAETRWDIAVDQQREYCAMAAKWCDSITVDLSDAGRVAKVAEFLTIPTAQESGRTIEKELVNG